MTNIDNFLELTDLFWRKEERQWKAYHCFFTTKFSIYGRTQEVETQRQLSGLSSSSRFVDLLLTIFIFDKNCSQKYVLPTRLVITPSWSLSTENLSSGKESF